MESTYGVQPTGWHRIKSVTVVYVELLIITKELISLANM